MMLDELIIAFLVLKRPIYIMAQAFDFYAGIPEMHRQHHIAVSRSNGYDTWNMHCDIVVEQEN